MLSKTQFALASLAMIAFSAGLFSVVHNSPQEPEVPAFVYNLYSKWKVKYGQLRATPAEHRYRLKTFFKTYEEIKELRKAHPKTQYALNAFADMNMNEFLFTHTGALPAPVTEADLEHNKDLVTKQTQSPLLGYSSTKTVPTNAIKYQGSCGSCWAFATVKTTESSLGGGTDLSEQAVMNCNSRGKNCSGGNVRVDGVTTSISSGVATESAVPYLAAASTCNAAKNNPYNKNLAWLRADQSSRLFTITAIKNAIQNTNTAVAFSLNVGTAFRAYRGGIFDNSNCQSTTTNHAVNLVGWTSSGATLKIANSWDTWWGDAGYMWITPGSSNDCVCGGQGMYCPAVWVTA